MHAPCSLGLPHIMPHKNNTFLHSCEGAHVTGEEAQFLFTRLPLCLLLGGEKNMASWSSPALQLPLEVQEEGVPAFCGSSILPPPDGFRQCLCACLTPCICVCASVTCVSSSGSREWLDVPLMSSLLCSPWRWGRWCGAAP